MSKAASEREKAIKLARTNPPEALKAARMISDPWYKAQALAWVARYARAKASEKAISESRIAAQLTDDIYKQVAVLAWPIRAAIENSQHRLAGEMLADAIPLLPKVEPLASRAEAAALLLDATSSANSEFWKPLLVTIAVCCPANAHWRAKRLHHRIREFLATVDRNGNEDLADMFPSNDVGDGTSKKPATISKFEPRQFFW